MQEIKLSLDTKSFKTKPNKFEITNISNRIASENVSLNSTESVAAFVKNVALRGYTFCPATFSNSKRCKDSFEQQQLFALDFDNKDTANTVTFEDIKKRADYYDLPMVAAYETFSSTHKDKFRVLFLNDVSVTDRPVAEAMQYALYQIFPEADKSCINDVSKMYFGGRADRCLFYDKELPQINIDTLFRSLTYHTKKTKGDKHYKEHIRRISNKTGVALNDKGLFDVTITDGSCKQDRLTEDNNGATEIIDIKNGGNSPNPFIYIKGNGENPPFSYIIKFKSSECTRISSVCRDNANVPAINHKLFRSSVINEMNKCKLYTEFNSGNRKLSHNELFHILNNMVNIETGVEKFLSVIGSYPELYGDKADRWKEHADYNKKNNYKPSSCDAFCSHRDCCNHARNILSSVHKSNALMEKADNYKEEYHPISEVEDDLMVELYAAFDSNDDNIHVIKAQTAIGKSTSFLRLMAENPDSNVLVAAPTNLLKEELFKKAQKNDINAMMTPSLDDIMDQLPNSLSHTIEKLYACGLGNKVHRVLKSVNEKKDIPCLKEYLEKRKQLLSYDGSLITTHRYLLSMDKKRLNKFDCVIIDEDIIFKSVISNQGEISVSDLLKLKDADIDPKVKQKASELLKMSRLMSCIEVESIKWDEDNDLCKSLGIDIPAFCAAKQFIFRNADEEPNLKSDTFAYMKPVTLLTDRKYIIVSATADETIYKSYFGRDNVVFHECKQAKYTGRLCQHYRRSMSRFCIDHSAEIINELQHKWGFDDNHVITFKSQDKGSLHFGNTEGSNSLEGEDILVIGTPYHAEFIYKLAALLFDIDFDEDEKAEKQLIEHNGYRTYFTTFKNPKLRDIQFWMLESELEQAVGRARLLRKNCTVHLYSNFPLRQAQMQYD